MRNERPYNRMSALMFGFLVGTIILLAGCGSIDPTARYGGTQNAVHDMLGLLNVSHTLLVATHIGLYRSADLGQTFTEVAGGPGQPMDGLSIFKLAQSPIDSQRIYALAVVRSDDPEAAKAQPGIYTSDDAGQTWSLASPLSVLPGQPIFTIGTGSTSAGQVFTFVPSQGTTVLYESDDFGKQWKQLPPLPDSSPQGITGIPGNPHGLYLWSATGGFYSSTDDGQIWTPAAGIQAGIFFATVLGDWIYACSPSGLYVSHDGGAHFSLVYTKTIFTSVVASPDYPQHAYGLANPHVALTDDGGKTWQNTTTVGIHLPSNSFVPRAPTTDYPGNIAIDPGEPNVVYTSFSHPVGVDISLNNGKKWQLVMP
jgi:photosystem II stability/assembly factor-like uncharacterized protein